MNEPLKFQVLCFLEFTKHHTLATFKVQTTNHSELNRQHLEQPPALILLCTDTHNVHPWNVQKQVCIYN